MRKFLISFAVLLLLMPAAKSIPHSMPYRFTQGSTAQLDLSDFICNEMEILRFEDLPVETQRGIAETKEKTTDSITETMSNLFELGLELETERYENISAKTEQTESPYFDVEEDTTIYYKEIPFKIIGPTRINCPAVFQVKVTDKPGFYYIPLRLYGRDITAHPDIRYVGVEVLEKAKPVIPAVKEKEEEPEYLPEFFFFMFANLLFNVTYFFFWLSVMISLRKRRKNEK